MPTSSGPNTLGESNLVFAYDTGDTENSYKGQPTVNAFGTYPTDLYSWASSGNACTLSRDTISSPIGSTPLKMVTTGNDAYTSTYNSTGNNISAASSGQTWTISVWAKANQNTTGQIFHFGANSSGNVIDFSATVISLTTEWTRYTYTRTFTNGNVVAIQARLDGADTFQSGDIIWWDGLQVEQKAYATQFTTGTRSATQGLLPLVGNSTIDLSNVSFNSKSQIIFDGTNDDLRVQVSNSKTNITMEGVFYVNLGTTGTYLNNGNDSGGYCIGIGQFFNSPDNQITALFGGVRWILTGVYYEYTGYHHIVMTLDETSTPSIYVNGKLIGTYPGNPPNNVTPGTGFSIGSQWGIRYSNTICPVSKFYNRVLSANEIKQNYQQYKTRFNLS